MNTFVGVFYFFVDFKILRFGVQSNTDECSGLTRATENRIESVLFKKKPKKNHTTSHTPSGVKIHHLKTYIVFF